MFTFTSAFVTVALSISSFLKFAQAQNYTTFVPAASTFYASETATQFSINIANDSSDVYFYFASPAYSWVGVGFGQQMEDSLMLIIYPDADGNNVTISPRIGRKGGEPIFTDKIDLEVLDGTRIEDGLMILHARCSDCRVWPNGFLDATSPHQPMIYAFGGPYALQSSSDSADLKRHVRYGHFTIDMRAATGTGGVPLKSNASTGVQDLGVMTKDKDRRTLAHAILGCVVLFVVWPLNVLIAGFLKNIRIHAGFSVAVILILSITYGLGISTSNQFNRSKVFNTPHQILAIISIAPLSLLSALPARPLVRLHRIIPRLHVPLSNLALTLLLVSGGLGLQLSQQSRLIILTYTALSLTLVIFLAIIGSVVRRRGPAYARATQRLPLTSVSSSELGLLGKESRAGSEAGSATSLKGFLDESRRGGSMADGQQRKIFGGGTMPGPQYLLNMHPGVPVHIGSGRRI
ncbi:iron reductase domain protein [Didymella exigua CBS 183.55]|uniref:Iron reductase domain protein n=1 Tax=Didymella exigua CBS 183.55 TaxID=1150837 RepID=A0A6A5R483_9PLEO|nr:iron reductase domain protein [Didymella exigua CBS 183.55]KAF1922453.1 iron reductase domain protein [Didymella exigua CBS 183.55]